MSTSEPLEQMLRRVMREECGARLGKVESDVREHERRISDLGTGAAPGRHVASEGKRPIGEPLMERATFVLDRGGLSDASIDSYWAFPARALGIARLQHLGRQGHARKGGAEKRRLRQYFSS